VPVGSLPIGISPPELIDPTPGEDVAVPILLVWETTTNDSWPTVPIHFQVQIADDANFTTNLINVHSSQNPTNFEYESSPGVWTALPSNGLAQADLGKNVRYAPGISTVKAYFWRVSIVQFF